MNFEGVVNSLKRGVLSPAYLFYGGETYIRDELVKKFISTLLPPDVRDFNLDIVEGKEKGLAEVVSIAQTLPFMADKRLIIVKDAHYFKPRKRNTKLNNDESSKNNDDEKALIKYLENPNLSTVLVFVVDEGIDKRKKIFNVIGKQGQVVEFFTLRNKELRDWIENEVKGLRKNIDKEAVERLILNAGDDLRQLKSEIEKLVTYIGDGQVIKAEYVDSLVTKKVEHNAFQIIDRVGEKNFVQAIKIIREMIFLGEQPVKIMQMVGKQYRVMMQVKELSNKGYSEKQIAEITASHPFVVKKSIKASRNFTKEELEKAVVKTKEYDYKIKSGQLEPGLALELYLLG